MKIYYPKKTIPAPLSALNRRGSSDPHLRIQNRNNHYWSS